MVSVETKCKRLIREIKTIVIKWKDAEVFAFYPIVKNSEPPCRVNCVNLLYDETNSYFRFDLPGSGYVMQPPQAGGDHRL